MQLNRLPLALATFVIAAVSAPAQVVEQVEDEFYAFSSYSQSSDGDFGHRVALSDRWVFVNAPIDRTGTVGSGSVYAYERTASGLALNSVLYPRANDTSTLVEFGFNGMDARGAQLVVATLRYVFDSSLPIAIEGRAHVYEFNGTQWVLDEVLTAPDYPVMPKANGFGASAAFASDHELLVAAPGDEPAGSNPDLNTGSVYVFRKDLAGDWQFHQKVFGPQAPNAMSGLGIHMEASADHAIAQGNISSIELVKQSNGDWTLGQPIDYPLVGATSFQEFDYNDDWMIVGDPQESCQLSSQRSRAYVFRRDPTGWILHQTLLPQDSWAGQLGSCNYGRDKFGTSVDLDGDRVVIGSPSMRLPTQFNAGQVSVFELQGNQWIETHTLTLATPQIESRFGASVGLKGDTVVVGAKFWRSSSSPLDPAGSIAIFDLPRGMSTCAGQPNSSGQSATLNVYGNETAALLDIYSEVEGLPPGALCLGLVAAQSGFVMNPAGSMGNLCLSGVIGRFTGQAGPASPGGEYRWQVTPAGIPLATGFVPVQAGSTWVFQSWYRDSSGGVSTSNFSSAVRASFE